MKNIVFKFACVLTMFLGMTSCSPNLDEGAFLRSMLGKYTLTATGVGFIIRELAGYVTEPVAVGTDLEIKTDGSLYIIFTPAIITPPTPAVEKKIAQFIRLELEDRALYRLEGVNTYVAMGKADAILPLLISTTNGENSENNVFFEHLVPIAREKSE